MRLVISFILLTFYSHVLTAAPTSLLAESPLNENPLPQNTKWDFQIDEQGRLWLAYYAADGTLYVRRPDGTELPLKPKTRLSSMSGLATAMDDEGLSLIWRDKLPQKGIYYVSGLAADSDVFTPKLVDNSTNALTRLKLAKNGGETFFLWYGEKPAVKSRKAYNLFFRYLAEDDTTFSETYAVMPGIYPAWIVDEKGITIFSKVVLKKQSVMALRRFDREKNALGPVEKIVDAPPALEPYFEAFRSADRWFLMWLAGYRSDENSVENVLEGVYSDDQGKTWQRFSFEKLRNFNISQIDVAVDNKGHLVLTLSGKPRSVANSNTKFDIYVLSSSDNGTTWTDPTKLRPTDVSITNADFPSAAFDSTGNAVVVWQDWQDIRSNVYASYSEDFGATWAQPMPVADPASVNITLDYNTKAIFQHQGKFSLVAEQFKSDELYLKDLALYTFTLDELTQFSQVVAATKTDNRSEKRLRERIDAYWQAMENKEYETAYTLFDPFFRARRPLELYLSNKGYFNHYSHKVNDISIKGNIAKVQLDFEASVPEFTLGTGEKFSRPKKTYSVNETWLFVGDDWYLEYYTEQGDVRFTRY